MVRCEELFKLWNDAHHPAKVERQLGTPYYLDLYFIMHWLTALVQGGRRLFPARTDSPDEAEVDTGISVVDTCV
jgi:hypothetical protein